MERWRGKVAIVTGASSGIGEGIARLLAKEGLRVVAVARRLERLQTLAEEIRNCGSKGEVYAVQGDVSAEEDVKRVVRWTREKLGGAHVLVNNAGVGNHMSLAAIDTPKLKQSFDVNVIGLCMFTSEVIKDMQDRGVDDGHIFHIGSTLGQRTCALPGSFVYAGTKHAIRVMTEGLRRDLMKLGSKIRITEISPGVVRSEIRIASGRVKAEEAEQHFASSPCLEPRDVAEALVYALGTQPHVQVHEILIQPIGQEE